jgi:C_GCAxxG_C_C family probable redox protein
MTDDTVKLAMKYFSSDYNCAQSVMKSVLENKGMDFNEILHLAAGFGGGMGLEGHVCGAVSGAVAALGVLNSGKYDNAVKHKKATYASVKEFIRRFAEKNGSIICNDLTGIDMSDETEHDRAVEDGTFEKVCPGYVNDAVRIVLDITK